MDDNIESAKTALLSESPETQARGVEIIRRLSESGHPTAKYAVATWYLHGSHDFPVDLSKARDLLEDSSRQLVPDALYDLATFVEKYDSTRGAKRRAFGLYLIAALLGDEESTAALRRCMYWGIGTFKNREAAELIADYLEKKTG